MSASIALMDQVFVETQPLHITIEQLTSTPIDGKMQRLWKIFESYDINHDNELDLAELKQMIDDQQCEGIEKRVRKKILRKADKNHDGRLDFEEFCSMYQEHEWFFKDYFKRYYNFVVPPPKCAHCSSAASYKCKTNIPYAMITITSLQIALFIGETSLCPLKNETRTCVRDQLCYVPNRRNELWRFITYMLVHSRLNHLLMNLFVQLLLGVALELYHGWWRIALIYVAGGLAGSLIHPIFNVNTGVIGASGGVFALATAHMATVIMNWNEMQNAIVQVFIFIITITTGMTSYEDESVSHVAHLAGGLAGLLVGILVLVNVKKLAWETKLWWLVAIVLSILITASLSFHIFSSNYFPELKS